MTSQLPDDLTALLRKWDRGEPDALDQLVRIVYPELKRLARIHLNREHSDHAILTGTLVHEAFMRLVDCRIQWQDRNHFFSTAARIMRRVLVDEARRRNAQKRGSAPVTISLDEAMIVSKERDKEVLALNDALEEMERLFPRKCRVVELRYFAGLSIEETADAMGVSADIVKREWFSAKIWLRRKFGGPGSDGSGTGKTDR